MVAEPGSTQLGIPRIMEVAWQALGSLRNSAGILEQGQVDQGILENQVLTARQASVIVTEAMLSGIIEHERRIVDNTSRITEIGPGQRARSILDNKAI